MIGTVITIAEPDLKVLATQVPAVPDMVLIPTVAVGVGLFLVVAMLRTIFRIKLSHMLIAFYLLVFILSIFVPNDFIPVAFDSGGVTTGPITVPFIMALGIGMAIQSAVIKIPRMTALASWRCAASAPFWRSCCWGSSTILPLPTTSPAPSPDPSTTVDVAQAFGSNFPVYFEEVLVALVPILVFSILFQLISHFFRRKQLVKVGVGMVYTFIGLVLFLTGANVGFMPAGQFIGSSIAASPYKWLLIPIGMVIGYFIVTAEPAVHVLNRQVEEISQGAIPQKSMRLCLWIGVAVSIGLSMVRVLTGISIYWILIPGYAIAIGLTFFVPPIFTGIAFDSGGVASGPMTATFLLPFAMGACESLGGNILNDAFGVVAMVAMTPLDHDPASWA